MTGKKKKTSTSNKSTNPNKKTTIVLGGETRKKVREVKSSENVKDQAMAQSAIKDLPNIDPKLSTPAFSGQVRSDVNEKQQGIENTIPEQAPQVNDDSISATSLPASNPDSVGANDIVFQVKEKPCQEELALGDTAGQAVKPDSKKPEPAQTPEAQPLNVTDQPLEAQQSFSEMHPEPHKSPQEILNEKMAENLRRYEENLQRLNKKVRELNSDIRKKDDQLAKVRKHSERKEQDYEQVCIVLAEAGKRVQVLEAQVQQASTALDRLGQENSRLKNELEQNKAAVAIDVAAHFGKLLQDISDLAGQNPEKTENLSLQRLYYAMQENIQEATGVKPVRIPHKSEIQDSGSGMPILTIDADAETMALIQQKYDWNTEKPFEGLPDGQRKRSFRLLRWGWRVGDKIIARAVISLEPDDKNCNVG